LIARSKPTIGLFLSPKTDISPRIPKLLPGPAPITIWRTPGGVRTVTVPLEERRFSLVKAEAKDAGRNIEDYRCGK
jgi:hypothetical protein